VKTKLMIVDNDEDFLEELKEQLEASGYEVYSFTTGLQALKNIKDIKPLAALIDLDMPEMNGYELGKKIKEDPENSQIPLIAMTGRYIEDAATVSYYGMRKFLIKPFDPEELEQTIEEVLKELKNN
jgi:CheY-like chemotaxis protein